MLSPVLCIHPQETMLQIETGRQRDPKESWMEESHRSFYAYRGFYTEKSFHKANPCKLHSLPFLNRFFALMNAKNAAMLSSVLCILPQETMLQIEIGRQRDPKESWMQESHRSFYTHRGVYAEKSLHKAHRSCYTKKCLRRGLFTHRRVCTQKRLDREVFTQRSFYTQKHCFHMFFALFCILPQETTLQIETGRQRDPKESWREETHRSFLPTHTGAFTQRSLYTE